MGDASALCGACGDSPTGRCAAHGGVSHFVRALTHDEQAELSALLMEIHRHTDGCDRCGHAMEQSQRCEVGRELQARWEKWLER